MDLISNFIKSKKKKAFYRPIKRWLEGDDSNVVDITVELSSMLTHSLIEVKEVQKTGRGFELMVADALRIDTQSRCISEIIHNQATLKDVRQWYLEVFGEAFDVRK